MRLLERLFANAGLIDIGVPLLAAVLSIYAKCVTRNDRQSAMSLDDFAVGLDLAISALLIFVVSCAAETERAVRSAAKTHGTGCAASAPWIVLGMVFAIWVLSTLIRKYGWDTQGQLRLGAGVVGPIAVGVAMLLFAVTWPRGCEQ